MENSMLRIGTRIINARFELAKKVTLIQNPHFYFPKDPDEYQEVVQRRAEIIFYLGQAFVEDSEEILKKVNRWGDLNGRLSANSGISLEQALIAIPAHRKFVWQLIEEEAETSIITMKDFVKITAVIEMVFDQTVYAFTLAYVDHHKKMAAEAAKELALFSMSIVPVTESTGVIPLANGIHSKYWDSMVDICLNRSMELNLRQLVIDFSSVASIGQKEATVLSQLIAALQLIGVKVFLTGLSPRLTIIIVNANIQFSNVPIYGNLREALKMI